MPMSAAERMRKYRTRIKNDPQKREDTLSKDRNRWHQKRKEGKVKMIEDMTARGKKQQRKYWRQAWERSLEKKKKQKEVAQFLENASPPESPEAEPPVNQVISNDMPSINTPKCRGRKKVRKDRAAAYRELFKAKLGLIRQKRLAEKYRKRYEREKKKTIRNGDDDMHEHQQNQTPRSKIKTLIRDLTVPKQVKRMLFLHAAVSTEIKNRMKRRKNEKEKQILSKLCAAAIRKKYRLKGYVQKSLSISHARQRSTLDREHILKYERRSWKSKEELRKRVEDFFVCDSVSRLTTGKRDTITKEKHKEQKRLLTTTMKELHKRFVLENVGKTTSYTTFTRLRPFWVTTPTLKERETCLCKIHENGQLLADSLANMKLLEADTRDIERLAEKVTCDIRNKNCAFGICKQCDDKEIPIKDHDPESTIEWWQWIVENIGIGTENAIHKRTVKVKSQGTVRQLQRILQVQLKTRLCRHIHIMRHQYKTSRDLKKDILGTEALIHIDFSENYLTKQNKEVQSAHFGASQQQITLHTGMLYTEHNAQSFCSISDCRRHDAPSIWAHIDPVLKWIKEEHPSVKNLYFFSDGPTTQYRNKTNLFLMSNLPMKKDFENCTWHFWEAGHGKGAPDGVGAAIKRRADDIVAHGKDITNTETLVKELSNIESKIKYFIVRSEDIEVVDEMVPKDLMPVKGTMKIHQVISNDRGQIQHRDLSCYCSRPYGCSCFPLTKVTFIGEKAVKLTSTGKSSTDDIHPKTVKGDQVKKTHATMKTDTNKHKIIDGAYYCVAWGTSKDTYIAQVLSIDDDNVEVIFMAKGPDTGDGRRTFYWPSKRDLSWEPIADFAMSIKKQIAPPSLVQIKSTSRRTFYSV